MKTFIFLPIFLFFFISIYSREPFSAKVIVDCQQATVSSPNLVDLTRSLKSSEIKALIPFYTPISPVSINFNLRGIKACTAFAADSTTLVVSMPQVGIFQTFTGGTREESLKLFKDFIRDGGDHHRIFKGYPKYSPIDPIAGNPNSLMAQIAQSDYLLGKLSPLTGCDCSWTAQPIVHQFQAGLNAGRGFSGGFDTTAVTMPNRYSYSSDLHWAFIVDLPLTYIRNGGASSLFGSMGFGLRVPATNFWSLTPIVRFGTGGTLDLCTAGNFVSAGIVSALNFIMHDYVLTLTNYASYISSVNFWLTGVDFSYRLHNYIFKNGLSLTSCRGLTLFDRTIHFSIVFIDSFFAKDRLYIRHYDEVGIYLITNYLNPCLSYDSASLGFAYQFGQKGFKGLNLQISYQF